LHERPVGADAMQVDVEQQTDRLRAGTLESATVFF
jgi:hypothetical protein